MTNESHNDLNLYKLEFKSASIRAELTE